MLLLPSSVYLFLRNNDISIRRHLLYSQKVGNGHENRKRKKDENESGEEESNGRELFGISSSSSSLKKTFIHIGIVVSATGGCAGEYSGRKK